MTGKREEQNNHGAVALTDSGKNEDRSIVERSMVGGLLSIQAFLYMLFVKSCKECILSL